MDELFIIALLVLAPFSIAPNFLLGMYAARMNLFANPQLEIKKYKAGALILLPLGLLMKGLGELQPPNNWTDFLVASGATILSFGYIFTFALLYTKFTKAVVF